MSAAQRWAGHRGRVLVRPAGSLPDPEWTVTDPHAPDQPVVPVVAEKAAPAWIRPRYRGEGTKLAWLALAGVAGMTYPQVYDMALIVISAPFSGSEDPVPSYGWTIGVVLLSLAGLWLASRIVSTYRWSRHYRRREVVRAEAELAARAGQQDLDAWTARHQVRRAELPEGPLRAGGDRLVELLGEFERSRTCRDGWIDAGWKRTLRARRWSLLSRLRDSVAVRADLAAAAGLTDHSPDLAHTVAVRGEEIAALDTELADAITQVRQLTDQAHALDTRLEADDATRAERDRAEALARKLGAEPATTAEADQQCRRLRDQLLAAGPARDDLSILAAQLHALAGAQATS